MLINSNQFLFLKLYIIKIKPNNIQNRSLKNGPVIKKKGIKEIKITGKCISILSLKLDMNKSEKISIL